MTNAVRILLATIGLLLGIAPALANRMPYEQWVSQLRREALSRGIAADTFDQAFAGVKPLPRVLELDSSQPEMKMSFSQYIGRVVPAARVEEGRRLLRENRPLLDRVGAAYGVPARVLVALWGIESNYGQRMGDFSVIAALATLAYDGRRSGYFRKELLAALRILNEGHIGAAEMKGSWAGAMGQCQFMPSSFLSFAVDHDGDGRRDIWKSRGDVFESIANYMRRAGWRGGELWGREVRVPAGAQRLVGTRRSVADWHRLGVRTLDGAPLPTAEMRGQLIAGGDSGRYFLVYDNFKTILAWNRSNFFALAVGLLSDAVED